MMFKVNFLATLLVVGLGVSRVAATLDDTMPPPACVLACVGEQPQPADLAAICPAKSMQTCLKEVCDADVYDDAEAHFVEVCKNAGLDVANEASASASASKTSSSATASSTSEPTGSASDEPSASGTADLHSGAARIGAPVCVMLAAMAVFVLG